MARPLRIQYENAYYHVTCRGNSRQRIFFSDADHAVFLEFLERSAGIYETEILAYVLMSNHFQTIGNQASGLRMIENMDSRIWIEGS